MPIRRRVNPQARRPRQSSRTLRAPRGGRTSQSGRATIARVRQGRRANPQSGRATIARSPARRVAAARARRRASPQRSRRY